MPGMMDTVLNLGLNDETVDGLAKQSGDERFAYDSYRRFIQMYGNVVLGVEHHNFEEILETAQARPRPRVRHRARPPSDWKKVIEDYKAKVEEELGKPFPQDPQGAALGRDRRRVRLLETPARRHLPPHQRHPRGLGHRRQRPGDGVRQHGRGLRHRRRLHPQPLDRRQGLLRRVPGQRAGRGRRRRHPHAAAPDHRRQEGEQFHAARDGRGDARRSSSSCDEVRQQLEKHYRDMQDIEFTVEQGKLYMLQTRNGKRTAAAALKIAVDLLQRRPDRPRRGGRAHRPGLARPAAAPDPRPQGQDGT